MGNVFGGRTNLAVQWPVDILGVELIEYDGKVAHPTHARLEVLDRESRDPHHIELALGKEKEGGRC
jgi:hypothetical protein